MFIRGITVSANTQFLCDVIFGTFKFMTLHDLHNITKSVTKFWIYIQTPIKVFLNNVCHIAKAACE